jgi:hypothetical protein
MATKDFSSKQENMVAEYLGWETVVGSGSRNFHYGDLISLLWLGECKTHVSPQSKITFQKSHWEKIVDESMFHHRSPVLVVDNGTQKLNHTYCLFKYEFDSLDTSSAIEIPNKGKNINLTLDSLNDSAVYMAQDFDKYSKVYICTIERFKRFLEDG